MKVLVSLISILFFSSLATAQNFSIKCEPVELPQVWKVSIQGNIHIDQETQAVAGTFDKMIFTSAGHAKDPFEINSVSFRQGRYFETEIRDANGNPYTGFRLSATETSSSRIGYSLFMIGIYQEKLPLHFHSKIQAANPEGVVGTYKTKCELN